MLLSLENKARGGHQAHDHTLTKRCSVNRGGCVSPQPRAAASPAACRGVPSRVPRHPQPRAAASPAARRGVPSRVPRHPQGCSEPLLRLLSPGMGSEQLSHTGKVSRTKDSRRHMCAVRITRAPKVVKYPIVNRVRSSTSRNDVLRLASCSHLLLKKLMRIRLSFTIQKSLSSIRKTRNSMLFSY